jgi:hypothetical protein
MVKFEGVTLVEAGAAGAGGGPEALQPASNAAASAAAGILIKGLLGANR